MHTVMIVMEESIDDPPANIKIVHMICIRYDVAIPILWCDTYDAFAHFYDDQYRIWHPPIQYTPP